MQRFAKVLASLLGAVALSFAAQSSLLPASAQTLDNQEIPHRGSPSGIGRAVRPSVSGDSRGGVATPAVSRASADGAGSDAATLPASGSVLYSFGATLTDGHDPYAGVIQASDGNFYGVTVLGGSSNGGTFYKLTPSGQETILHSFTSGASDGR